MAATVWWLGTGSPQKDTVRAQPGKAGKGVLSGPFPSLTPPRPDADRCPVMAASSGHTCSAPLSPDPGSPAPGAQPAAPHRYGVPISAHLSATSLVPPFLTCHAGQDSHAHPPHPGPGPGPVCSHRGLGQEESCSQSCRGPAQDTAGPCLPPGRDEGASPGPQARRTSKLLRRPPRRVTRRPGREEGELGAWSQFPDVSSLPSPSQEPGLTVEADGEAAGVPAQPISGPKAIAQPQGALSSTESPGALAGGGSRPPLTEEGDG